MDILIQLILNTLIVSSVYAFLGIGFTLMYLITKFFNFSYINSALISGYVVLFMIQSHWSIPIAISVGLLFSGLTGYLQNKFVFEPLRKKNASPDLSMVASFGLLIAVNGLISILYSSQIQQLTSVGTIQAFQFGGGNLTIVQLFLIFSFIIALLALYLFLNLTSFGAQFKTISSDMELANVVGLDTNKFFRNIFIICGVMIGVVGVFIGFDAGLKPSLSFQLVLKGISVALIGGLGNIYGALLGAFTLGLVENFAIWTLSGDWKDGVSCAFLILFLLYKTREQQNQ